MNDNYTRNRNREARMTKAKRQAAQAPADGPTPERMAKADWQTIDAPRLSDEDWRNRGAKVRKVACRVSRMRADGWISDEGARALLNYQAMIETAGYDRGRSSLDFSPRGNGQGMPPHVVMTRDRLAAIRFALAFEIGHEGVAFVGAVLGPFGCETVEDVTDRMRSGYSRANRRAWARDVFSLAADELVGMGL